MNKIIIGEAVALEIAPAGVGSRILGGIIDAILSIIILIGGMYILFTIADNDLLTDEAAVKAGALLVAITAMVGFPATIETLTHGRSVGKLALGIQVVCDDGSAIKFRHAMVRALIGTIELWLTLGAIALFTSLFNERGKRVGDYFAGTYAVRVRVPAPPPPPMMPYHLTGWAQQADMRALPDALAMEIRLFIARLPTLTPPIRASMGVQLAAQVERYVSPGPPAGTPPEFFLMAVMAERRNRETVSLLRTNNTIAQESNAVRRLPFGIQDPPN